MRAPSSSTKLGPGFNHAGIISDCANCHDSGKAFGCLPASGHPDRNGKDCVSCHTVSTWKTAFSHTPTPTQCAACHGSGGLNEKVPRIIVNKMYHGEAWLPDCVTCHAKDAGVRWSGTTFDHTIHSTSCEECHAPQRPTGPAGTQRFDHGATVAGGTDCVGCHLSGAGKSWSGAGFSHSPVPTSCTSCHSGDRPTGVQGTATLVNNLTPIGGFFNHATGAGGMGDCVTCHATSSAAGIGVTFGGAIFPHNPIPSTCMPCHTAAQRPTGNVGTPPFNHAIAAGGTGDCVSCHASIPGNVGKVWSTAVYTHTPVPTACASCHRSDPLYTAIQTTIKNQMNHSFPGLPDCAPCHSATAQARNFSKAAGTANGWYLENLSRTNVLTVKGPFHANFSGALTTCIACHTPDVPPGTVPDLRDGFTHAARFGTECASCHRNVPGNVGLTWKAPFFNHLNNSATALGTCSPCHDQRRHYAGRLCTECHRNVRYPTADPGAPTRGWAGGSWGDG